MIRHEGVDSPLSLIEWGVSGAGEVESGDLHVVAPFAQGVLIAVVDGLGHGAEAAVAAQLAVGVLRETPSDPVTDLLQSCHKALQKTRGAVISLACFRAESETMTWAGIGNAEGILIRAPSSARPPRESLLLQGGVVGYQMPSLRAITLPVFPGDTLIFATDGVYNGFNREPQLECSPNDLAAEILRRHAKPTDDALVLVARYVGNPRERS